MKKVRSYIQFALLATVLMTSCITRDFDPAEDIKGLSEKWSDKYVGEALNLAIDSSYTVKYVYNERVITSVLKDTLSMDIVYRYSQSGDSVNVTTSLRQTKDSIVITTDGYIYADKFWAHLFTKDSGIVNGEGVFHVDFYETGKTTPWAWSEIRYHHAAISYYYDDSFKKDETETGWY